MQSINIHAPAAKALSRRLKRPIVFFDLEHTGGTKDTRGITQIGAIVVSDAGVSLGLNHLIKPGNHAVFNPYVCELTGITAKTVKNAPSWKEVAAAFVLSHQESIWAGFNSRASDTPQIKMEHSILDLEAPTFLHQLDVMKLSRFAGRKGNLGSLISSLAPHAAEKAHCAIGDAKMTLALFEALAEHVTDEFLMNEQLIPRVKKPKPKKSPSEAVAAS